MIWTLFPPQLKPLGGCRVGHPWPADTLAPFVPSPAEQVQAGSRGLSLLPTFPGRQGIAAPHPVSQACHTHLPPSKPISKPPFRAVPDSSSSTRRVPPVSLQRLAPASSSPLPSLLWPVLTAAASGPLKTPEQKASLQLAGTASESPVQALWSSVLCPGLSCAVSRDTAIRPSWTQLSSSWEPRCPGSAQRQLFPT